MNTLTSFHLPPDKTMLDVVTFTASLASKTSEVDPQLDRVRAITSQRSAAELTKDDIEVLNEVYQYIENYLVTKEQLRSFTRASIQERVHNYLNNRHDHKLWRPLAVTSIIAFGGSATAFLVPPSFMPVDLRPILASTIFFQTINLSAAWMFWSGLENFKDKIRQAYLPICLGMVLLSLSFIQTVIVVILKQENSVWFQYVTSGIAIPIADGLIYIGIRRFAQISGMQSKLLSGKLIAGVGAAMVGLVILAPWPDTGVPRWALVTSLSILCIGGIETAAAARIAYLVRSNLGKAYKRPMAWFIAYVLSSTTSCVLYACFEVVATPAHPYRPQSILLMPLIVSLFVSFKAGIAFRQIDVTRN